MAKWSVHVDEQNFEVDAGNLDRATTRAKREVGVEVTPWVEPEPESTSLLAPLNHGQVLFFDNLADDLLPKWQNLSSPDVYGDGPTKYIFNEGVSPSPFVAPWNNELNPVARQCWAPSSVGSKYDGPSGSARTGCYKSHTFKEGEYSIAYLDFRLQPNQTDVFPDDIHDGGGNSLFSQLLQFKTWEDQSEPEGPIFAFSQGRNGIKTHFSQNRLGNELLIPLTPGRWYRLGVEAKWSYQAGQGWAQIWINDQDPKVMRAYPNGRQVFGSSRTGMRTKLGNTYYCFGPYFSRENFNGDVRTEYANPCVVAVS